MIQIVQCVPKTVIRAIDALRHDNIGVCGDGSQEVTSVAAVAAGRRTTNESGMLSPCICREE